MVREIYCNIAGLLLFSVSVQSAVVLCVVLSTFTLPHIGWCHPREQINHQSQDTEPLHLNTTHSSMKTTSHSQEQAIKQFLASSQAITIINQRSTAAGRRLISFEQNMIQYLNQGLRICGYYGNDILLSYKTQLSWLCNMEVLLLATKLSLKY